MTSRTTRRLLTLALISGAALFSSTPAADAGLLVASATNCADQSLAQEFLPWADVASYTVAPGGDFEPGSKWALSDGAGVVSGNEPFYAGSPSDAHSLALADGATATSPSICVGIEHPDIRFFARSSDPTATLRVQVLFEDAFGNVQTSPMGSVTAGSSWSPSAPLPIVVNLFPLLPGSRTAVAFRLSAVGGSFQVDDVYVDPYRSR